MKIKPLFITGISTNVGKTICAAVLCEQLKADYWKPVQAGDLGFTDSDRVREMVRNPSTVIYPEAFKLELAASPHQSAAEEGIEILPEDFKLPETNRLLLIEGAGGVFVPLSSSLFMIDLITRFDADAILVVRNYLGCINHTLLSIAALKQRNIAIKYMVLNGDFPEATKSIILEYFPEETTLIEIPEFK